MKIKLRITLVFILAFILLILAACSIRDEANGISTESPQEVIAPASQTEPTTAEPTTEPVTESDNNNSESNLSTDEQKYQKLVADIIEQYQNNSVDVSDMFPALPNDFEFPDSISGLEFQQDEMGYITTSVFDKNNNYEMYIRIDDMSYDGVKPEGNPHIRSVFFSENPQTQASSTAQSSSVAESAPVNSTSVSIVCNYMYEESAEKTFTDTETADTIMAYFQNLTESTIEMTPKTGGVLFTVTINDNGNTTSYCFNSPQRDGTLYCKNISATEWTAMTGWLQVSDTGAYDYVASLFSEYLG